MVQLQTQYTSQMHQVFLDSSTCIDQPRPLDMWTVSALEQGLGFRPVTLQCLSERRPHLYQALLYTMVHREQHEDKKRKRRWVKPKQN